MRRMVFGMTKHRNDKMAPYQRSKLVLNFDAVATAGRAGLFGCSNLTVFPHLIRWRRVQWSKLVLNFELTR